MQLSDIEAFSEDQAHGRWFDIADPVTGLAVGIRVKLAGPDSDIQNRARLKLAEELADLAGAGGVIGAEQRETARINSLARCVIDWEIQDQGQSLKCTFANVVRFLKAAAWVQAQVDAFAADRAAFREVE